MHYGGFMPVTRPVHICRCGRFHRYLAKFELLALPGNDHQPAVFATSGSFCL